MDFKGKNILLTGASSGIGYQLAIQLANAGANLALLARRKNILDQLVLDLSSPGSKILAYHCDVSDKVSVAQCMTKISTDFQTIDIAIMDAGIDHRSLIADTSVDIAENIFAVNVLGLFYFVKELLPFFAKNNRGILVGVSSLAGTRGFPGSGLYCASKAAVSILLESMRLEFKKYHIKVLTVKPGFVNTPMTEQNEFKMPFVMTPKKAAGLIIRGIKKERKIISFPFLIALLLKVVKVLPNWFFDFFLYLKWPSRKNPVNKEN